MKIRNLLKERVNPRNLETKFKDYSLDDEAINELEPHLLSRVERIAVNVDWDFQKKQGKFIDEKPPLFYQVKLTKDYSDETGFKFVLNVYFGERSDKDGAVFDLGYAFVFDNQTIKDIEKGIEYLKRKLEKEKSPKETKKILRQIIHEIDVFENNVRRQLEKELKFYK